MNRVKINGIKEMYGTRNIIVVCNENVESKSDDLVINHTELLRAIALNKTLKESSIKDKILSVIEDEKLKDNVEKISKTFDNIIFVNPDEYVKNRSNKWMVGQIVDHISKELSFDYENIFVANDNNILPTRWLSNQLDTRDYGTVKYTVIDDNVEEFNKLFKEWENSNDTTCIIVNNYTEMNNIVDLLDYDDEDDEIFIYNPRYYNEDDIDEMKEYFINGVRENKFKTIIVNDFILKLFGEVKFDRVVTICNHQVRTMSERCLMASEEIVIISRNKSNNNIVDLHAYHVNNTYSLLLESKLFNVYDEYALDNLETKSSAKADNISTIDKDVIEELWCDDEDELGKINRSEFMFLIQESFETMQFDDDIIEEMKSEFSNLDECDIKMIKNGYSFKTIAELNKMKISEYDLCHIIKDIKYHNGTSFSVYEVNRVANKIRERTGLSVYTDEFQNYIMEKLNFSIIVGVDRYKRAHVSVFRNKDDIKIAYNIYGDCYIITSKGTYYPSRDGELGKLYK